MLAVAAVLAVAALGDAGERRPDEPRAVAAGACGPPAAAPTTPPLRVRTAANPDDSSERTEFYGGGVYRVTRCGPRGELRVSMTVGPVNEPDGQRVNAPYHSVRLVDGQLRGAAAGFAGARGQRRARASKRKGRAKKAGVIRPTGGPETRLARSAPARRPAAPRPG